MPSKRILIRGSVKANGINSNMAQAMAVNRVSDQSRPLVIWALQRGQ
ncbi:hypothetical protein YPPY36_2151 [Yersinia pestis PY-36]|nr:hypothetical protein YPPY16_2031 [Yersinia pestis PY-16]EIR89855.1 hypothetical protein YPPY36_2151 [Yersinia pestis PY-36]EIS44743.1 hypothetical protein YPPY60_2016 [Yersinia pestis PY-60]EIS57552.1 hypothetical protein YPPY61_2060 [Yersinia pestis PY-61]EIS67935.1 hypothetical protein YPPY65_2037 [Yersinia pestis PY-65]